MSIGWFGNHCQAKLIRITETITIDQTSIRRPFPVSVCYECRYPSALQLVAVLWAPSEHWHFKCRKIHQADRYMQRQAACHQTEKARTPLQCRWFYPPSISSPPLPFVPKTTSSSPPFLARISRLPRFGGVRDWSCQHDLRTEWIRGFSGFSHAPMREEEVASWWLLVILVLIDAVYLVHRQIMLQLHSLTTTKGSSIWKRLGKLLFVLVLSILPRWEMHER